MKRIDFYLLKSFLSILVLTLMGIILLFAVVDIAENLNYFIDASVALKIIFTYYRHSIPGFLIIGLPMAVLISTIFTIGTITSRNELTAMKSSGISLYRIAVPILLVSIFLSVGSFYFEDQVVTSSNQEKRKIEKEYLKKASHNELSNPAEGKRGRSDAGQEKRRNIFLQKSDRLYIAISQYLPTENKALGVAIQFLDKDNLQRRIDADWMQWDRVTNQWKVYNYAIRDFSEQSLSSESLAEKESGSELWVRLSRKDTSMAIGITPKDISREGIFPADRNHSELKTFIKEIKNNGVDTTRWEVILHEKISFAFTNFIVALFAIPLVAGRPKGGLSFGAGASVMIIFIYYAFIRFGQTLGFKGILTPLVSAWIGNGVFLVVGALLLLFVRK